MTPKLLSPEVLDECLKMVAEDGHLPTTSKALRAHIAALEADKDTLLRSVERLTVEWVHPDEHARALVRARNEGLERAAVVLELDAAQSIWTAPKRIRAMKETEP